jgi:sec-independent protein translocase protein TatC
MSRDTQMSFWDHIDELRKRLMRLVLILLVFAGVSLVFTPQILKAMLAPYGSELKVISPTEGVSNYLRVGLICGFALSMPFIILEIWGFVGPGLLKKEKGYVYVIVPAAFVLFLGGACFSWFFLIPAAIKFLASFSLGIFKTEWTSQNYVPFVTSLVFWIGVSFEMPLVAFVLAKLHVITARLLLKGWRFAIVAICLLAAIITPTVDPFNMVLVALPLTGLYFFSILLASLARGRAPREGASAPAA